VKMIPVTEAVGMVLCHDITKIVPGQFKGRAFKKGHTIDSEDIGELLKIGKEHIYVWEPKGDEIHENDAAKRLAQAACGKNLVLSEPSEGKVNLIAETTGVLKVNREVLNAVNSIDQVVFASRHTNNLVFEGEVVAGTRVVPLVIEQQKIVQAEELMRTAELVSVLPIQNYRVGLVTTGSEVFHKRIKDGFGPVVSKKFEELGSTEIEQVFVPDDATKIKLAIERLIAKGAQIIAVTGGMSVDPDDVTPLGIRQTGAEIISYGVPVLPGSMFLLAYRGEIPIVGLPGCIMYSKASVFDLVLPRILAGERLSKLDLIDLAHGGLCLQCPECRYPACAFGKV